MMTPASGEAGVDDREGSRWCGVGLVIQPNRLCLERELGTEHDTIGLRRTVKYGITC
jgi:hypothetical protein